MTEPTTYGGGRVTLLRGDCVEVMRELPDESVDAIVTDPPYGLGFMGKAWDDLPPGEDWARECLRVLKPGGHLLAFGGTRTWHRLAVAVEDAGFEVRDSIAWLYGSGFPKSLDVSKAIDKLDAADVRTERALRFTGWMRQHLTAAEIDEATGTNMGGHYVTAKSQPTVATADLFDKLRPLLPEVVPAFIEELVAERTVESENFKARAVVEVKTMPDATKVRLGFTGETHSGEASGAEREVPITVAHTAEAAAWQGWGTALKPAFEPIVVARKPLVGTVASNVLAHGTGALNIDGCRVAGAGAEAGRTRHGGGIVGAGSSYELPDSHGEQPAGRWPANVVLGHTEGCEQVGTTTEVVGGGAKASGGFVDGYEGGDGFTGREVSTPVWRCASGCPVGELDAQSGIQKDGVAVNRNRPEAGSGYDASGYEIKVKRGADQGYGGSGGASRFFYCAKAPTRERVKVDGVAHPTVKPLALMRWLVRLVTPPGGVVLEPFAGSGTTVEACVQEGFRVVAVEREADYVPLIEARLARQDVTPDVVEAVAPELTVVPCDDPFALDDEPVVLVELLCGACDGLDAGWCADCATPMAA